MSTFHEATLEELDFLERSLDRLDSLDLATVYNWGFTEKYTFTANALIHHLKKKYNV